MRISASTALTLERAISKIAIHTVVYVSSENTSRVQALTGSTEGFVRQSMKGQEALVHISEHFVHMVIAVEILFILSI